MELYNIKAFLEEEINSAIEDIRNLCRRERWEDIQERVDYVESVKAVLNVVLAYIEVEEGIKYGD